MKIQDIDILQKKGDLYDLTQQTFQSKFNDISFNEYKVQKGEEMRIDLVCQSIYGTTDLIDIILNVNNISNPLNIKEGSIILFPEASKISDLRFSNNLNKDKIAEFANVDKSSRRDNNRQDYVDQNYNLPPTVLENPSPPVSIKNNNLQIGPNLFNR